MRSYNAYDAAGSTDLSVCQCGYEKCRPGHFFGPAVRDHYLIHYILDGEGIFEVNGTQYHLTKGQGFLIYPEIVTYYKADDKNPWTYSWVGFRGIRADDYMLLCGMTQQHPLFTYNINDDLKKCLEEMNKCKDLPIGRDIRLTGLLYIFLSKLMEQNSIAVHRRYSNKEIEERYVLEVINLIEMNYHRKLTVEEIARKIGLNRSYLGALFKKKMNQSIQDYIIQYRINRAEFLLKNTDLSITEISRSVGYENPLQFSRFFKNNKSVSPTLYREQMKKKSEEYNCNKHF